MYSWSILTYRINLRLRAMQVSISVTCVGRFTFVSSGCWHIKRIVSLFINSNITRKEILLRESSSTIVRWYYERWPSPLKKSAWILTLPTYYLCYLRIFTVMKPSLIFWGSGTFENSPRVCSRSIILLWLWFRCLRELLCSAVVTFHYCPIIVMLEPRFVSDKKWRWFNQ